MKITWSKIKDYIYIGTLLIGGLLWWRDEVKEDARRLLFQGPVITW